MQALDLASLRGEFYYHVTTTSFGPYVDQIGRHPGRGHERVGVQGERRLAARRSRPGSAQRRRPRALVLGDVRADRRSADAAPDPHRPQLLPRRVRERPGHGRGGGGSRAAGGRPAGSNPRGPRLRRQAHRRRAGDARRRRPLERAGAGEMLRRLALLLAAACLLAGCGEEAAGEGSAQLWVTRDRGSEVVLSTTVPGRDLRARGAAPQGRGRDAVRRPLRPGDRRDRGRHRRAARLVLLRERLRGRHQRRRLRAPRGRRPLVGPPLVGRGDAPAGRRRRLPGAVPARVGREEAADGRRGPPGRTSATGSRS